MRHVAAALVTLALASGCGGSDEQTTPPTTRAEPPAAASTREPAPALSGESLSGETIALQDFSGRPVLINVWSSW
jgi:hypothetical protein